MKLTCITSGWLWLLLCISHLAYGQEISLADALALEQQGTRAARLEAGIAWSKLDSAARAQVQYKSVLYDSRGQLIADSLTGLALHKLGVLRYNAYDDAGAASWYRQAYELRDRVFPQPHNDRAHSRYGAATCLRFLGKLDSATLLIREATSIYEQVPEVDTLNWLRSLNELAALAIHQQDYRIAYSSSYRAIEIVTDSPPGKLPPTTVYDTYYSTAQILEHFDELDRALEYAQRAVELSESVPYANYRVDALVLLAEVYEKMRRPNKVEESLITAARLADGQEGFERTLAYIYTSLADYHGQKGDLDRSREYSERSRDYFSKAPDALALDYFRADRLPEYLYSQGRAEEALPLLDERLLAFGIGPKGSVMADSVFELHDLQVRTKLLGWRADLLRKLERPAESLADYELLFQLQDKLREKVSSDDSRRFISEDLRPLYDRAVYLAFTQKDYWKAYELSERARAYSLLTSIATDRRQLSRQELQLRRRIATLERKVATGESHLQTELEDARLRLDRLSALQPATRAETGPATKFERERLLAFLNDRRTDLLQYHLGATGALAFYITAAGELSVRELENPETIRSGTQAFVEVIQDSYYRRKSLRSTDEQGALDATFLQLGRSMARQLLPPRLLETLHPRARLCVVPDGPLNYLPFGALLLDSDPPAVPVNYAELEYLQGRTELFYSYASQFLLDVEELPQREYTLDLVGFAPSFGGSETSTARGVKGGKLAPLQYNQEEVLSIAELLDNSNIHLDEQATREAFLNSLGMGRIVHLSTHGRVNSTDPNLSYIAFTQHGDSLQAEQLLFFNDLYGLPLNNELTVLSACETSLGRLAPGETTLSLASAFAAAGSRSTLTTLWEVDDRATKDLIVGFYRRLAEGASRSAALSGAQDELRESTDFAHPYYWSALTLYGAAGTLELEGVDTAMPAWLWPVGIVVLLLLLGLAVVSRKLSA